MEWYQKYPLALSPEDFAERSKNPLEFCWEIYFPADYAELRK